ncbi:hypothetical protein Glove_9g369 [Diversispora epigaea]|uniref:DDE-1 domain-containing protein n=1 Tax=Diversispora epigaea TaxID=1348612 RepID=A0A397JR09_9GLOM|nr:hypothetical protein Glove_9g369 [Diversispora epigaea]
MDTDHPDYNSDYNPDYIYTYDTLTFLELELALREFILSYQHKVIPSDFILIEKAKLLATGLGVPENTLLFSSEALPLLQDKYENYFPEQIYNMNETDLFYRLKSDCTLTIYVLPKSQIICDLGCQNAQITSIWDLEFGILAKNTNYNLGFGIWDFGIWDFGIWILNLAWMLTTLFQEWLCDFDYKVEIKHNGQRILLLLDNCGNHKIEGLNLLHVDIQFLPLNTISRIQPMDAGIIMSFKRHCNYHIRWILEQVETGQFIQDLKMDVLQAIRFIIPSLNLLHVDIQFLPPNTTSRIQPMDAGIIMSFKRHYRNYHIQWILEQVETGQFIQDLKMDVLQAIRFIIPTLHLSSAMDIEEFLFVPEEDIVYELLEDDKIITELVDIFKNSEENIENIEESDDSIELVIIDINVALTSLENIQMFLF